MEQPEIKTGDLLVRPWREDDVEAIFRACQDPEIQRWTPIPRPYEMAHAVGFLTNVAGPAWENRTGAHFGVFDVESGQLLGSMGLVRMDLTTRTAELGYWIAAAARGRGVATNAGRAVAAWGFEFLGIERLTWRAEVGNHASRLVGLRIGFKMEGTQRGALAAVDGSGALTDGWIAAMRPGDVTTVTPAALGPDSAAAKRAHVLSGPMPTLAIAGGGLRQHTDDDLDAVTRACQDAEMLRWGSIPVGYQRSDAERYVRVFARDAWLEGHAAIFAIVDESNMYCGSIDLRISAEDPAVGEIGCQVAPWARGRGLAPTAARTVSGWGLDALGLTRIIWRAHVGNDASQRVAEKAGFTYEGIQRRGCEQRGQRRDAWIWSVLATDAR